MIYHKHSLVVYMLWLRYALGRFRPRMTLAQIYARHLESPGTKAFTVQEARRLFAAFRDVEVSVVLTHGDLLESAAGQRHSGAWLRLAPALAEGAAAEICPRQGTVYVDSRGQMSGEQ